MRSWATSAILLASTLASQAEPVRTGLAFDAVACAHLASVLEKDELQSHWFRVGYEMLSETLPQETYPFPVGSMSREFMIGYVMGQQYQAARALLELPRDLEDQLLQEAGISPRSATIQQRSEISDAFRVDEARHMLSALGCEVDQ
ncbi:hypothetical protein [Tropicimonas sp. IMCC6043]|uniref:hypothetical protein n=1 Tax=Tropicimonas sp. IMCC6043 TaxID=2510645 RepID=UPI00101C6077|nr:hypothetical protein [Tropicimonas sp. IMCC6043]RYH06513.1 hypothetical protein EU800_23530 [Tropicimonas sp. IMCC6043]